MTINLHTVRVHNHYTTSKGYMFCIYGALLMTNNKMGHVEHSSFITEAES
jgi:hypothetical protein